MRQGHTYSRFRLEIDVVLDTVATSSAIEAARRYYGNEGLLTATDEHGTPRPLQGEQFIPEIEDALLELSERNPLLIDMNIEIERISCISLGARPRNAQ